MFKHTKYTFQVVCHVPISENRQIDYISGNSQCRINILVSTHIFPGVRNSIKALFSVLDHHNMLKHTKYTFQMVRHMPGSENYRERRWGKSACAFVRSYMYVCGYNGYM